MFRTIGFRNLPPFGDVAIKLPPVDKKPKDLAEVHLFTGVNGTGKTRLLCTLASMLGNELPLRKRLGKEHGILWAESDAGSQSQTHWQASSEHFQVTQGGPVYNWCQNVPAFAYNGIAYLQDAEVTVLAGVQKPERKACLAFSRPDQYSQRLLQGIANLKIQAAMDALNSETIAQSNRFVEIVKGIETALSDITGYRFVFQMSTYPKPVLQVNWATTTLPFSALPDGLRSIIGWMVDAVVMMDSWVQGKGNLAQIEAVFLLDELESHLHPAWQRRILPAFQRLFPKSQIFVATHSPFIISSLNHGWIHRLSMDASGRVKVLEPQAASAGDSYISVVEEIMGISEWYDPETENILKEFRKVRDQAYHGDSAAREHAFALAKEIGNRSMELSYVMGKEVNQMERQLLMPSKK